MRANQLFGRLRLNLVELLPVLGAHNEQVIGHTALILEVFGELGCRLLGSLNHFAVVA